MSPKLGTLYRKYLRGSDLNGEVFPVKILDVFKVFVSPPPAYNPVEKWCLKVQGLPPELPDTVLFGPRGEQTLVKIFGQVDTSQLKDKHINIAPKSVKIAGQNKVAIVFRKPNSNGKPQQPPAPDPDPPPPEDEEDVVQFTDDADIPF